MNDATVEKILTQMQKNKDELKNTILASETRLLVEIENLKSKITAVELENEHLKNRVELLERNSREANIVLFGLDKEPKDITSEFVIERLNGLLDTNIRKSHLNNILCLGRSKNCPVKVEFVSYLKKREIFRNVKNLRGTGIYIENDLTEAQREEQKILRRYLRLWRGEGKGCFIRGNRLVVDGTYFSVTQLLQLEKGQTCRKSNSAPSTPIRVQNFSPERKAELAERTPGESETFLADVKRTRKPIAPVASSPSEAIPSVPDINYIPNREFPPPGGAGEGAVKKAQKPVRHIKTRLNSNREP
ncbi:uncharacterized protein LOC123321037 [Coccinella septempunctata]|uniref:uncharacterized protein LOC123321037 n=1 Tax=Coccinella septempunctata TaxID=41139 RepID=UPI001D07A258|nr:uncharacterized protein LOC123321037 [Coccinella septempunctata]